MHLVTSDAMQKIEQHLCQQYGIDTLLLMENAGKNVANEALSILKEKNLKQVIILCGGGNNGGDGLVAARQLLSVSSAYPVTVYLLANPEKLKKDPLYNYRVLKNMSARIIEVASVKDIEIYPQSLVIDALLGTGLSKPVAGLYREAVEKINSARDVFVLSVDVPSGINATSGAVMGSSVKADYTVTLGLPKRGLFVFPAREYTGKIKVADIGIPIILREPFPIKDILITPHLISEHLPERNPDVHKISAGVVGVIAGSPSMLGAGILASLGAYGAGAGMVVWPLPFSAASLVKIHLPEVVTPLVESTQAQHYYTPSVAEFLGKSFVERKCRSLIIGPGLGVSPAMSFFVEKIVQASSHIGGVIDADALNCIAGERQLWKGKLSGWIITPHHGEAARLLGSSPKEVAENRFEAVKQLADYFQCIAVLKGPATLIADPSGNIFVNPTGGPELATAGSGDVLSGVIAGILAQTGKHLESAICGVFLHGLAGDMLARNKKEITAKEIAYQIPAAKKVVRDGQYRIPFMDGD
ncbi:NAD(P)H-hydrate dehydratase [Atrimonas thermophila]|jgi:NAD(P)H-hydrate epimerase|uniref:NAD(P)H-hydrate dehydratase n=1 Tax=Atrimonas thermophila TaxID=3064161 RepID=UPI00399D3055